MGGALHPALAAHLSAETSEVAAWRSRDGHLVRAATADDARRLAPALRVADHAELRAAVGMAAEEALLYGVAGSTRAFAVVHRDAARGAAPLALFGVSDHPLGPDIGAPWLLAHRDLPRIARALFREAGDWIAVLGEGRAVLSNCVDARNGLHIRWLGLMGFRFVRRIEAFGAEGRPFFEFVKLIA